MYVLAKINIHAKHLAVVNTVTDRQQTPVMLRQHSLLGGRVHFASIRFWVVGFTGAKEANVSSTEATNTAEPKSDDLDDLPWPGSPLPPTLPPAEAVAAAEAVAVAEAVAAVAAAI